MNFPPATLAQALAWLRAQGQPPVAAQTLLLHALGQPQHARSWLLTHDDLALPATAQAWLAQALARLQDDEPLAYVLGWQAFYGLDLQLSSAVLVPRPDTETLVDWALAVLPADGHVLDLGTGSGAVALALKAQRPELAVWASDASPAALAMAQANAQRLGLAITWAQGTWLHALPPDAPRFDAIVANPPYIAEADPHLPALRHEPMQALTSGPDGLDDLRQIIASATPHLRPGGWLLLEHGYDQAAAVQALLHSAGYCAVQSRTDLAGHWRCSGAQWTPTPPTATP